MIEHELKIGKERLFNLVGGRKSAEIRLNDRDYQAGDVLVFTDNMKTYKFRINHVHSGLGLQDGYVSLSVSML